jgi:signal transduction histidine kinase
LTLETAQPAGAHLVEEERRRIALDIHDDPLQRAILLARELRSSAEQKGPLPVSRWQEAVDDLIVSLRAVCADLRPAALDRWGLAAGLEQLVRDAAVRSDLEATFSCHPHNPPRRLPCGLETALYRVAQEALNNCMKHARASKVEVTLSLGSDTVSLVIADDGQGSGAATSRQEGLRLGLRGMHERLAAWGGWVQVRRGLQGGTVVEARTMVDESRRAS